MYTRTSYLDTAVFLSYDNGGSEQCKQIQLDGPTSKHRTLAFNIKIHLCCYNVKYIIIETMNSGISGNTIIH